jgi:hypothetical protein
MEKWREEAIKDFAEIRASMAKTMKGLEKLNEQQEKTARNLDKFEKMQEEGFVELRKSMKEMSKELGGIGRSNGKVAEDYFFSSLEKTKTLGGVHFDVVKRNLRGSIRIDNGKTLDDEYDITLINDNSLGLVEVKYTVEKDDVKNLVKEQVENFKQLFPMYAKYKFYLGIGGLSFGEQAEDEAKKLGVGIFKLNGDAVEIYDKNLKVY